MTSIAYIEDNLNLNKLVILTDRAQGMTSLANGEIEIMIQRQAADDGMGVGEDLVKNEVIYLNHWLIFTKKTNANKYRIIQ